MENYTKNLYLKRIKGLRNVISRDIGVIADNCIDEKQLISLVEYLEKLREDFRQKWEIS